MVEISTRVKLLQEQQRQLKRDQAKALMQATADRMKDKATSIARAKATAKKIGRINRVKVFGRGG